jgi:hypothetical protein
MSKITVTSSKKCDRHDACPTCKLCWVLDLIKTGKYKVLTDTASVRGMIRKVIHLVDVVKGEHLPARKKPKKGFEVIAGSAPAAAKKDKKSAEKTSASKSAKAAPKPAKKAVKVK